MSVERVPVKAETGGAAGGLGAGVIVLLAAYFNGTPLPPEVYALVPVAVSWLTSKALRWFRRRVSVDERIRLAVRAALQEVKNDAPF